MSDQTDKKFKDGVYIPKQSEDAIKNRVLEGAEMIITLRKQVNG